MQIDDFLRCYSEKIDLSYSEMLFYTMNAHTNDNFGIIERPDPPEDMALYVL